MKDLISIEFIVNVAIAVYLVGILALYHFIMGRK